MANPSKQDLSRALTDMKFMKRSSTGGNTTSDSTSGALIEKWSALNIPESTKVTKTSEIHTSYVEFEELNKLGRFSYNKYNRDIEELMKHYCDNNMEKLSDGEMVDEEDDGTVEVAEVVERREQLGITKVTTLGKRKHY